MFRLKYNFIVILFLSIISIKSSKAMEFSNSNSIDYVQRGMFEELQEYFRQLDIEHAISEQSHLIEYLRSLEPEQVIKLFEAQKNDHESSLKMLLRLIYSEKCKDNIDTLPCFYFINNINGWLCGWSFKQTPLFDQNNLQYILPLLEPFTGQVVKGLALSNNKLALLPTEICYLSHLDQLSLYKNNLVLLPTEICNLTNLIELNLFGNELVSLPLEIGHLSKLERLFLSRNKIEELPPTIGDLRSLRMLCLSRNKLSVVPKEIGSLGNLEHFDLSNNKLEDIPEVVCTLINLEELNISNNHLKTLPKSVDVLIKLRYLLLDGNPGSAYMIKNLPKTLILLRSYK